MKRKLAALLSALFMLSALAACGGGGDNSSGGDANGGSSNSGGESSVKVAAIFGGSINDGNWNETQYNGLMLIKEAGADTSYAENVGDADVAETARTYASEGYNLIYLTTNSYQDYCLPIAADFPDVTFIQINGTEMTDNFFSVRIADEEQGFMMGVAAALMSESGKVGFIGGMEINPIKLGSTGFEQGVAYANENYGTNVTASRVNTGSFTDVNQAKETTISLIESGCDIVTPMANDAGVGVMEAAEEKQVPAIASGLGQESSAPTMTAMTIVKDVSIAYDYTYAAFTAGELHPTEVELYGANKGVVYLTNWTALVTDDVKAQIEEVYALVEAGQIDIDPTV